MSHDAYYNPNHWEIAKNAAQRVDAARATSLSIIRTLHAQEHTKHVRTTVHKQCCRLSEEHS